MKDINCSVNEFYKNCYEGYMTWIKNNGFSKEDAEDIIQISITNAVYGYNSNYKFNTYLHKIILNEMKTFWKINKKHEHCEYIDIEFNNDSDVEYEVIAKETMDNLPEIIKLWIDGYTYDEISEKLKMTYNSVRYNLNKYSKVY